MLRLPLQIWSRGLEVASWRPKDSETGYLAKKLMGMHVQAWILETKTTGIAMPTMKVASQKLLMHQAGTTATGQLLMARTVLVTRLTKERQRMTDRRTVLLITLIASRKVVDMNLQILKQPVTFTTPPRETTGTVSNSVPTVTSTRLTTGSIATGIKQAANTI